MSNPEFPQSTEKPAKNLFKRLTYPPLSPNEAFTGMEEDEKKILLELLKNEEKLKKDLIQQLRIKKVRISKKAEWTELLGVIRRLVISRFCSDPTLEDLGFDILDADTSLRKAFMKFIEAEKKLKDVELYGEQPYAEADNVNPHLIKLYNQIAKIRHNLRRRAKQNIPISQKNMKKVKRNTNELIERIFGLEAETLHHIAIIIGIMLVSHPSKPDKK